MQKDKLIIFDTTMRDGEQSPGAAMTRLARLELAGMRLGCEPHGMKEHHRPSIATQPLAMLPFGAEQLQVALKLVIDCSA